jgi:hypothetical protein
MGWPAKRCMAGSAAMSATGWPSIPTGPAHQPRQLDGETAALICQPRGAHPR